MKIKTKFKFDIKDYGILFFFILLFAVLSMTANNFASSGNILNVLRQVSVTGIVAVGEAMAIITSGIDLSVGSVLSASGVLTAYLMVVVGMPPLLACLCGIMLGVVIGMINALFITKVGIPPLITTLATMTGTRGISYIITKGVPIYGFPKGFSFIGQGHIFGVIPVPVVIMLCVFVIGWIILNKLPIGRYIYGLGGNEEAVRLSGINTNKVKFFVYTMSGLLTGFAGVIFLSRVNSAMPSSGTGFEMDVITAVVLGGVSIAGGTGKLRGVVIGVLMVGFLLNGLIILKVPEYYQYIVRCVVLLLAVGMDKVYALDFKKNRKVA